MVCSAEASQLLQMLPHRLDLDAEKDIEHVCSEDPVRLVAQVDACWHKNLSPSKDALEVLELEDEVDDGSHRCSAMEDSTLELQLVAMLQVGRLHWCTNPWRLCIRIECCLTTG